MRRLLLVVAILFSGCAGVPCVCVCDDGQPRQRVESPAHVRALEATRRLEAEAERMRAQIRAWDELEALDEAAEAAGKAVDHASR